MLSFQHVIDLKITNELSWGFSVGSVVKNPPANAGDLGLDPRVGKIPRRRTWQLTPVFLPGESQEQRSLAGHSL